MNTPVPDKNSRLTPEVIEYIDRSVLCWLATSSADGQPNVSPKEVFTAYGDTEILIADIASPESVRNIRANPRVCASFIDVFVQKGFKLIGLASLVAPHDPGYEELVRPLEDITRGAFMIRHVIRVHPTQTQPIVAPSYWQVPGTTEDAQIVAALRTYGVTRRES